MLEIHTCRSSDYIQTLVGFVKAVCLVKFCLDLCWYSSGVSLCMQVERVLLGETPLCRRIC